MKKAITVPALIENIQVITDFAEGEMLANSCPMSLIMQINVVIDELFSNIANYAYINSVGNMTLELDFLDNPREIVMTIKDAGVKYNPLEKADPDTTLSAEERPIGGLGIFIVKKSMDELAYIYEDNNNILVAKKKY